MWGYLVRAIETFEVKDVFTLLIAAYGAILATFNYVQSRRKDRRRVVVSHEPTFHAYADGNISTQMTSIKVANHGYRPVVVSAPTVQMPSGKFLSFIGSTEFGSFPKKLEDGESASITVLHKDLAAKLKGEGCSGRVKLRPNCTVKTDQRYWGKKWIFDMDK